MFKKESVIDITKLLNDKYIFYAHTNSKHNLKNETLHEHTSRCIKHFIKIIRARELQVVFNNFEHTWLPGQEEEGIELFYELIINTIAFHDIGKINPLFQNLKMKNIMFSKEKGNISLGSEHSIISAILYLEYYLPKSKNLNKDIRKFFRLLTYLNAYIISKHHGNLGGFEKFLESFYEDDGDNRYKSEIIKEEYKKYFKPECTFIEENNSVLYAGTLLGYEITDKKESINLYAYEKLIYSLLIASDYYATTEYNNEFVIDSHGTIEEINRISHVFNNTEINQGIKQYSENEYLNKDKNIENVEDINVLRSELYLDAEKELFNNIYSKIFYLEAPTGSGKSNVAFNLSFNLIEKNKTLNKIMYIYPFNTLVEQNLNTVKKIFGNDEEIMSHISVVNSITPILKDGNENHDFEDYEKALLDRQFFNYPITLSTHVTLFDLMFGNSRESGFAFYQIANSVIVLDEIQSYKNTIWAEIISFFKVFSEVLNFKVIIMSATLPDLDILSEEENEAVKLIIDRDKYFLHPLFKDRVELNYELIDTLDVLDEISNRVIEMLKLGKKVLIEFIKKNTAIEFYRNFLEIIHIKGKDFKVELMTGDDSNAERERILHELEDRVEGVPCLLIATQVIEAGVDLKNIDIGFKDISKLDSEEQFMGRVNRSSKKKGIVYFFNYDNGKTLYKNDVRINDDLTLKSEDMRKLLKEKNFEAYYSKVLKMIKTQNESYAEDKNTNKFFIQVGKLDVPVISERMQLIDNDDWSCSVFFNRKIRFVTGEIIEGEKIWSKYKELIKNKEKYNYAEWRIKLSSVKSKMNYFIYQVSCKSSFPYTEQFGEMFYIDCAEQYFEKGKFIREKFENQVGAFI